MILIYAQVVQFGGYILINFMKVILPQKNELDYKRASVKGAKLWIKTEELLVERLEKFSCKHFVVSNEK
jgi:hypothetical protein